MSATQLHRWERGTSVPGLGSVCRYLAALGCDLCDLQLALVHVAGSDSGSQARFIAFLQALGTDAVQEQEAAPAGQPGQPGQPAPVAPALPEPVAGRVLHLLRLLTALSRDPRSIELIDRLCRLERP